MRFDENRLIAADELLGEVVAISQNQFVLSHLPQIGALLKFLENVGLCVLDPTNDSGISGKNDQFPFFSRFSKQVYDEKILQLYPMFAKDADANDVCRYFAQAVKRASYGPQNNCVVVNVDSEETLRMLALSFIHELGHAQAAFAEGRILKPQSRSEEVRLYEEAVIYTMEVKLTIALGGPEYVAALELFVWEICEFWQGLRDTLVWQGRGAALDFCFGSLPSPAGNEERDKTFLAYAQIMAADFFFPQGSRIAVKMEIIKGTDNYGYAKNQDLLDAFRKR